jgi:hypothetical protein
MVRRREEGARLSSCSYLSQYDKTQRSDRRRGTEEDRSQSGRSRILGFKLAVASVFSCGEADEGALFGVGLSGEA